MFSAEGCEEGPQIISDCCPDQAGMFLVTFEARHRMGKEGTVTVLIDSIGQCGHHVALRDT